MLRLDFSKFARHEIESFVPTGLAEPFALADQRRREAIRVIDIVPSKFAFDAGGDSVRGAVRWLDLQDVAVLGPDIEGIFQSAIHEIRLGAGGLRLAPSL